MGEIVAFLKFAPDVEDPLVLSGLSLDELIARSAEGISVTYGPRLIDSDNSRTKDLLPVIVAAGATISGVVVALTALLNAFFNRPHYSEWEELEELTEDGKIVRDQAGNPIWKLKRRQALIEPRSRTITSSTDFHLNPAGIMVRIFSSQTTVPSDQPTAEVDNP